MPGLYPRYFPHRMNRFAFPTALLLVASILLGPLLLSASVVRARSPHEVLCGDHGCGCDGRTPIGEATCCCVGALRAPPGPPAPPPGIDPARWALAWGDAPACRPATLHDLPAARWASAPCGVDLAPEGTSLASPPLAPLPAVAALARPGTARRRVEEARVQVVRHPTGPAKVPITRA